MPKSKCVGAGYGLVNTKKIRARLHQRAEHGIAAPRFACSAQARNLEATEYVDHGHTGASERRPALDRLMNDARKRRFDCVLVWRFDRFVRSTKHLLLALEEFRSLKIQFISYQENINTTSPLGQALFTIVSAIVQLEPDLIRERVKAGLRNAGQGPDIG